MTRSAAFALGAALMLDGATAARAADLYLPDATSVLADAGVLPSVPENWSDLPVQLKFSEAVGYNSNVLYAPSNGAALGFSSPTGTLYSISTVGASTKAYWEGQQFFANGSIGLYRYFSDADLNSLTNSIDIGDNWTYGSKCSGKLIASEEKSPAQPGLQVGFNVLNFATTMALNETSNCLVSGEFSWVLNSGVTSSTNSTAVDQLNNFQSEFIAAGIKYSVSQTNSLQLLATVTGTNFTDRASVLSSMGLLSNVTQDQVDLTYTKDVSPRLTLIASGGLVGVRNASFSLEPASGFQPVYSFAVKWAATPKLGLTASVSKTVAPPTSLLANLEVSESANLGLSYNLTPKVLVAAGVAASHSSAATPFVASSSSLIPTSSVFTAPVDYYSANASVNYSITPFITANLSYTFTKSVQSNLVTPTSVVLLALSFNPY